MKTLISCLLALALLLPGGALAEEMPMLLEEDGLRLALNGWQSAAGEVVLRLCCDNDTGAPAYPYPCTALGKTESADNNLTSADDDNIVSFAEGGTLESLYPEK